MISDIRNDTLREQVTVVILDTMKEVTTITVRESETGDTLLMTTVTDRTRASTKDRYHDVKEKVIVRTDTVYVEREAEKTVAQAGTGATINAEGNIIPQPSYIKLLKWVFLTVVSITVLIIVFRIFVKR